ncbi:proteasome assembly chaperone 3-like [Sorex fumeus]|uniref:proteasome assembly chaperone 3-like n=1 Tax=Sorex fumeus TaxID=62283 RepID=UPI0024AD752A|nr:proteasome assembly chaperone 3-like [Sorex fumeus]
MENRAPEVSKQKSQVMCRDFVSYTLVVVMQLEKMGMLVALEPGAVTSCIRKHVITTRVLLGPSQALLHLCHQELGDVCVSKSLEQRSLLAFALKNRNLEGLQGIAECHSDVSAVVPAGLILAIPSPTVWTDGSKNLTNADGSRLF